MYHFAIPMCDDMSNIELYVSILTTGLLVASELLPFCKGSDCNGIIQSLLHLLKRRGCEEYAESHPDV